MKVIIFGANGFIGSRVYEYFKSEKVDVVGAGREATDDIVEVDLFNKDNVKEILSKHKPSIIISCAGIVENSEKALISNPIFTTNIIQAVLETDLEVEKILISGSAGEYGIVGTEDAVNESTTLLAENNYARSKLLETSVAMFYKNNNNLPVYIYRPFNPIGPGMHPRFLIPNVIKQMNESKEESAIEIEISRKDALRDYIDVRDIASSLHVLITSSLDQNVYNVGSGKSTSNEELIRYIAEGLGLEDKVQISETQDNKEPKFAVKADIEKLSSLGWKPNYTIIDTIADIIKENK